MGGFEGVDMRWYVGVAAILLANCVPIGAAETSLQGVRSVVEQWVQTRQLISRTEADWEADKEALLQTKVLFERELAGIDAQMGKLSTNSVQVDRERAAAEKDLKEASETIEHATGAIRGIEARLRGFATKLPAPLLETVQPLMAKLPEDSSTTKLGAPERVQTVVSLLNEIDKFNNAVTLFSEKRKNEKGDEVSVETAYLGLGAGYFVNQTGEFAGSGVPGEKGWEWTLDPGLAESVREVVRIYRGERTATFVPLPVVIR